jgi:transcriptional regulator with XRE-family HTH domain
MKVTNKEKLIEKLEARRLQQKISVRKMCANVELENPTDSFSHANWIRYLQGTRRPSWDKLFAVAAALDVKIEIDAQFRKPRSKK